MHNLSYSNVFEGMSLDEWVVDDDEFEGGTVLVFAWLMIMMSYLFVPPAILSVTMSPSHSCSYTISPSMYASHNSNSSYIGAFLLHDLQSVYGRKFRCSWYREYLTWSDRDQVSGGYAISRSILSNGGRTTVASVDTRPGGSSKGGDNNSNKSSIVNSKGSGSGNAVGRLANTSSTRSRFVDSFHEWIPITTPYNADSSHAMPSNTSHRRYLSSRHRETSRPVAASRPVAPIRPVDPIPSPYVRILPVSFHW